MTAFEGPLRRRAGLAECHDSAWLVPCFLALIINGLTLNESQVRTILVRERQIIAPFECALQRVLNLRRGRRRRAVRSGTLAPQQTGPFWGINRPGSAHRILARSFEVFRRITP